MLTPCIIWMIIACIAIILEVGNPGLFFFLSLSIGSVFAAFASRYTYLLSMQIIFFLIGTVIAVICFRFWLKYTERSTIRTNINALIGKPAVVIKDISFDQPGYVKVEGEKWLARSVLRKKLGVGLQVRIVHVRGAHVVVEELEPPLNNF